ncbi:glycosyltransferase [Muricoccus pecuniae]|uniref:Glycosyltransferase involved in cell wall biosynthesis n=1 Tax=Muricoccus pecuniae TaxID=693023 RepID=A0A840Y9K4_9PROT|nr:glycosyltransferase [Roseomonas pecuniae]MBB5693047.1 glycosyltransferase involved in cell wall biosynthesis [Roseomonas pecuniae]
MKICIASPDIVGPIKNGGVGTACTALAQALAAAGHEVTLFYTSTFFEIHNLEYWQEAYRRSGVELIGFLPESSPPLHRSTTVYDEDNLARSYRIYERLKHSDYDLIHFVDYIGLGYYTALAKSQGLCLAGSLIAVTTHSPTLWSRLTNAAPIDDISYMVRDRMERRLIELSDLVISPSHYMLRWLRENDFKLPARQIMLPNLMPIRMQDAPPEALEVQKGPIRELVFFGRIEPRKGLLVFCDAIDRIGRRLPPDVKVTFMGKLGRDYPQEVIEARTAKWKRGVQILTGLDTFQAADYLKGEGRLAVLAALHDNSPYTVMECVYHGIPFISSDVGGVAELIAPESRDAVLYPPTPAGMGEHILRTLATPDFGPCQSNVDFPANKEAILSLHRELEAEIRAARTRPVAHRPQPLVTINILHFERPEGLGQALAAIDRQTYPNIETIIVDNGSQSAEAVAYLDQLEASGRTDLRIIRMGENVYEPTARNAGAYAARGKYVLFMDDDNVPKVNEVEVFCTAAEKGGADVLTCFTDHFVTDVPPENEADALKRYIVMGDFGPLGLIYNGYGDLNCFVRRDRFLSIGGFVVDGCFNHAEDWRFFAKAWAKGLKVDVVPESLLWYRTTLASWGTGWRKRDRSGALMRAAQVYLETAPEEVKPFLLLSQGLFWKASSTEAARRTLSREAADLRRQVARLEEEKKVLDFERQLLMQAYRALSDFTVGTVEGRLDHVPEVRRGLDHLRRVMRKYQ